MNFYCFDWDSDLSILFDDSMNWLLIFFFSPLILFGSACGVHCVTIEVYRLIFSKSEKFKINTFNIAPAHKCDSFLCVRFCL